MISPMTLRFIRSDEMAANPAAFSWFAGGPSGPIGMPIGPEGPPTSRSCDIYQMEGITRHLILLA